MPKSFIINTLKKIPLGKLLKDLTGNGVFRRYPSGARNIITGLRICSDFLEWTTLRESRTGRELLDSGRVELAAPTAEQKDNKGRLDQIKQHVSRIKTPVSVAIAADKMLMRIAELPATDPAEIAKMIQLQVDAFSPFPDERMCVAHEVLAVSDSVTRVLIAAVQKDVIESTGVMLKEAGLDVQRIDAEIMAWWQMIAPQSSIPGEGRLLILVIEKDGGAWIVADKKGPLALRALIPSGGLLPAEYVKEISDDAGTFMLSIDLEHGSAPLAGVEVWHKGIDAAELLLSDALKNHFRHEVITHSLDTLRPLSEGMAQRFFGTDLADSLRRVKKGQPVLDLVPQSWRSAIIARRVRLRLLAATVGVLIAWFLAMGVFLGLYQYQKYRIAKLEKHLKLLEGPKREVMEMQNKVKSFEQYLDRQNSTLECLREISQPLPKDVILTSFNFKKGKSFVIRGEALQSSAVTDYKKELDKSPLFNTVEMGAIKTGKRKEASIQTFDMTIKLKEKQ